MKLYRTDNGAPEEVPDDQVVSALQSQKYGLPSGAQVPIANGEDVDQVSIDDLQTHLDKGANVISQKAYQDAKLQKQYGGLGQRALTAVEQGLGSATLGISQDIEAGIFGNAEEQRHRAEVNPLTTAGAQLVGGAVPLLIPGAEEVGVAEEAGTLARVGKMIGAPTRGLARAGEGVSSLISEALDAKATDSVVSAMAKKVASEGVGAAVQGAGMGAAQHITEEALGDPNANGESLYSAMGHGAMLGFGAGAVLGAGGTLGRAVLGKLAPHIGSLAEEQAARAVAGSSSRGLESLPGGAKAAGRRLLDDGVISLGDTAEELAPKVARASKAADARVTELLETADKAGQWGPDVEAMFRKAERIADKEGNHAPLTALESATGVPSRDAVQAAEAAGEQLDRKAMIEGAQLSLKSAADLNAAPAFARRMVEGKMVPGIWDEELQTAADQAMRRVGGGPLEAYEDAKLARQQYDSLSEGLAKQLAKSAEGGPEAMSMGKMIGAGILGKIALGASLPHAIPAIAGGLALNYAKRMAAQRGASSAAVMLEKLSALHGIEQAVKRVDANIARGMGGIFGREGERIPIKVRTVSHAGTSEEAFQERVKAVQQSMAAPAAVARGATSDISGHAPRISSAFEQTSVRATQYLAGLLPKSNARPSLTPHLDAPPPVSQQQKAAFNRAFDVVHDPMTVLAAARDGRLTRDMVTAMKVVYPALLAKVQAAANQELQERKTPLTAIQKASLRTLLGDTPDVEMTRKYQATYQTAAAPPPEQNQDKQSKNKTPVWHGPKRPIESPARNEKLDVGRPAGS